MYCPNAGGCDGKSHSKWAVADAVNFFAAAVVFGSMNWTSSGNDNNDENTLYVKSAGLASQFANEFIRQWHDLKDIKECSNVTVEGADSSVCNAANDCSINCESGSCCDGVDNDYDGLIDLQEESCACADGVDNDGNGYIDLDDFAYQKDPEQ
ncbi:MAG: hypothetical protein JW841_16840 [Deltaproteobacteria bacterium]|nr:hypothetical protein [Deltaproteobacteria bacterium]